MINQWLFAEMERIAGLSCLRQHARVRLLPAVRFSSAEQALASHAEPYTGEDEQTADEVVSGRALARHHQRIPR